MAIVPSVVTIPATPFGLAYQLDEIGQNSCGIRNPFRYFNSSPEVIRLTVSLSQCLVGIVAESQHQYVPKTMMLGICKRDGGDSMKYAPVI
jgi:hypothetical protein